jgi:hypothetical protein
VPGLSLSATSDSRCRFGHPTHEKGRVVQSYFSEQNITRYKKLASGTLTAVERKVIFDFLAKEGADFRDHWNARFEGAHIAAEKGQLVQLALKLP